MSLMSWSLTTLGGKGGIPLLKSRGLRTCFRTSSRLRAVPEFLGAFRATPPCPLSPWQAEHPASSNLRLPAAGLPAVLPDAVLVACGDPPPVPTVALVLGDPVALGEPPLVGAVVG